MRTANLVTEFERQFNSGEVTKPVKMPISSNELLVLYLFAKWLDRKYAIVERARRKSKDKKKASAK